MALTPGSRLGPYEVIAAIGAGGMGEVYRARDTRLDRTVAIKVLPEHLASDPELRQRLEREARSISSLNHPHICTLYDVGREGATDFLVIEYLEGETLAQRLARGPLPPDQLLRYAMEIADALHKAHRNGVTHRDLKPGNVMITRNGTKLLDFGLAKSTLPETNMAAPTLTKAAPLTQQGTIIGTFQYMAPEQLEGKEADARSDIHAFGAMLFEMATGRRAFAGKSQASLIAAIMESEPPAPSSLSPVSPPALDRVVRVCLAKDPDDRWQTAHDIKLQLAWIAEGGSQSGVAAPVTPLQPASRLRRWLPWAAAGVLAIAAASLGAALLRERARPAPEAIQLTLDPPASAPFENATDLLIAFSPDGRRLALTGGRGEQRRIYVRRLEQAEAAALPGTEDAKNLFFSPDGKWIAFTAGGKLKKVPVEGGTPQVLCPASWGGGTWLPDDTIIFTPHYTSGLWRIPASGGTPRQLTTPEKGELGHWWPQILPGQKAVLFTKFSTPIDKSRIALSSLDTGEQRVLVEGAMFARHAPSGHLLYARSNTVLAVPFDLQGLRITGPALPVLDGVAEYLSNGVSQFSFSADGKLAYVPASGFQTKRKLLWVDRKGTARPFSGLARQFDANPRLSPDGSRLAIGVSEPIAEIWICDWRRGAWARLTHGPASTFNPLWTPDGKRVIFVSEQPVYELFWKPADGSAPEELLDRGPDDRFPTSVSPDGKVLVFSERPPQTGPDLWTLSLHGERKAEPFLKTPLAETVASFSPDGRWLAYQSNESGRNEVYVRAYRGLEGRWQVSTEGGDSPVWARSGRELFYRLGDKMMAVAVSTSNGFSAGKPVVLFEGPYERSGENEHHPAFDVTADGQLFVMVRREESAAPARVRMVLNWFEELKRRVK